MTGSLSMSWQAWRSERRKELIAEGMCLHLAAEVAAREAQGRARIAEIVGDAAARAADLRPHPTDPDRFVLVGDWNLVTPSHHCTVTEMMAAGVSSKH